MSFLEKLCPTLGCLLLNGHETDHSFDEITELKKEIFRLKETISELQIQHSQGFYTPFLETQRRLFEVVLTSISLNTCCDKCQEAALWAKKALFLRKEEGR